MSGKKTVTAILKLSFEELLYVECLLKLSIESATRKSKRFAIIEAAHKKIAELLDQADRDGLIDRARIKP